MFDLATPQCAFIKKRSTIFFLCCLLMTLLFIHRQTSFNYQLLQEQKQYIAASFHRQLGVFSQLGNHTSTQPVYLQPTFRSNSSKIRSLLDIERMVYSTPPQTHPTPYDYLQQYKLFLSQRRLNLFSSVEALKRKVEKFEAARKAVIVSTYRSGSSFMGELVSSHPLSFYFFEPMIDVIRGVASPSERLQLARDLLNCDMSVFRNRSIDSTLIYNIQLNRLVNNIVLNMSDTQQRLWFIQQACILSPLRVIKTVRAPLVDLVQLLDDQAVKIIFLARDPRATVNSRDRKLWCQYRCRDFNGLCTDLINNTLTARMLEKQYPKRVMSIRLEEFLQDAPENTARLFRFLGWSMEEESLYFLLTNTQQKTPLQRYLKTLRSDAYEKIASPRLIRSMQRMWSRKPNTVSSAWRQNITWASVKEVQSICQKPMTLLKYHAVTSLKQIRDDKFKLFYT